MLVKGGGAAWHLRKDDQELEIAEQAGRDADVGSPGRWNWNEEVQDHHS
jgi:hypothetical protein